MYDWNVQPFPKHLPGSHVVPLPWDMHYKCAQTETWPSLAQCVYMVFYKPGRCDLPSSWLTASSIYCHVNSASCSLYSIVEIPFSRPCCTCNGSGCSKGQQRAHPLRPFCVYIRTLCILQPVSRLDLPFSTNSALCVLARLPVTATLWHPPLPKTRSQVVPVKPSL